MLTVGRSRRVGTRRLPSGARRARFGVTLAVIAVISVSMLAAPTYSLFTATTGNSSTFGTAASFPTYPASVTGDSPWAYHKQEESPSSAATLTAADSSGNARTGTLNGYTNGPVTTWKFDENSGSTAGDSSGGANPGTLTNSPTWTTGKVGSAVSLNGTNQFVASTRAAVDTTRSFSVTAWVYLTDKTSYRSAITQDGTNVSAFRLEYNSATDRWAFTRKTSDASGASTDTAQSTSSPSLNTWHHLAGVYDSAAGNIKLYVNGSLAATTTHTTAWNATGPLAVGRSKFGGANSDFWSGRIDQVRVFQRALTAAEILSLGSGLPLLNWELSEGASTSVADRGTSGYAGQLVNGPTWTTSGHDGNAISFDGVDDRVTGTSGSAAVTTNTSFTVSAWVYLTDKTGNRTAISQDATSISGFYLRYETAADRFAFSLRGSDNQAATLYQALGTASPSLNTWYHLVGVHDSSAGNLKLYVNGSLEDTEAFASPWSATGKFAVGRALTGGGSLGEYWSGRIDTVKAWQRTISAAEVTDLYNGAAFTETDMSAGLTGALQGSQQGLQSTTAVAFAGLGNGYNGTSLNNPTTFTIECWFRSTSSTGGVIMGFADQQTGKPSNRDRIIYLDSGNRITFGVVPDVLRTVRSTATYNDGAWHHVAASLGAAGMKLYLDGSLVASNASITTARNMTGYWRWGGGEDISGWTNPPATNYFTGAIDEVATYTSQLTDNQIARHYAANH